MIRNTNKCTSSQLYYSISLKKAVTSQFAAAASCPPYLHNRTLKGTTRCNAQYMPAAFAQLDTPSLLGAVTDLDYNASTHSLLAATLDDSILVYDCERPERAPEIMLVDNTVLCMVTAERTTYAGSTNGSIATIDMENQRLAQVCTGAADGVAPDSAVASMASVGGAMLAATYGGSLMHVDARLQLLTERLQLEHKVFAMDAASTYIVCAAENMKVHIYDIRKWGQPVQRRDTGLKHQLCALRCFPAGDGYAILTIDGRVAVEYFDVHSDVQAKKYAFKCHRQPQRDEPDTVFPVNALEFDTSRPSILYTGGSDGAVCVWDWHARRRLKQHSRFPAAVTKLQMCGPVVAVAACDDVYRLGKEPLQPARLYIG